ncbi:MAG: hypothetical protein JF885_03505 [Candidatus Dormibacteraeota bacterium]|nr:hypothetical protein [Candidatus Dormibacteraeota bacterium]MBJ7610884.1 hypothetical protein [Candidatus Dormibacteraeota bacterium]
MNRRQAKRQGPGRRFNLTLDEPDTRLLEAFGRQLGEPPTKVAGDLIRKLLHDSRAADGQVNRDQVEAILRTLRGGETQKPLEPRWEWPVETILADGRWWDRWLPDLNELLGRDLTPSTSAAFGERPGPIVDRRGYSDLLEFLFPVASGPRGAVTWRSPQYPQVAGATASEGNGDLSYIWGTVIRHVTRALCALEEASQPGSTAVMGILTQDHITGPWLRTLRGLVGERPPDALPTKRLAKTSV